MYAIRPALRASTGRPPARLIRRRRYPSTPRLRPFHTLRPLAQASIPPPAPDRTPIDPDGADKADGEKAAADEQADAVATEDPEILAQKLQRSRESSRKYSAALRRQQRGKKTQGLPPVHLPNWFLNKCVIRHEDLSPNPRGHRRPNVTSFTVTHVESGEHASCTIPAEGDPGPAHVLTRLLLGLWKRRLEADDKSKVQQYLDKFASAEKKDAPQSPDVGPFVLAVAKGSKPEGTPGTESHDTVEALRKHNLERTAKRREAAKLQTRGQELSSLVVAEIRATIAASLSTLFPAVGDSFPSAKTNVILHSPTADYEGLIDHHVVAIAEELGSDIITLRAQDLAQLAGDYLGDGPEPSPRSIRSLGYDTYRLNAELSSAVQSFEIPTEEDSDFGQSSPDQPQPAPSSFRAFQLPIFAITPVVRALAQNLKNSVQSQSAAHLDGSSNSTNDESGRSQSQSEIQLEDLKLATLLEAIIDSNETKKSRRLVTSVPTQSPGSSDPAHSPSKLPGFFDYSMNPDGTELELNSVLPFDARSDISLAVKVGPASETFDTPKKSKIVYIKDFKELNATYYGGRIIQKLEELVRRRRVSSESIMIVGSTCSRDLTPELSASGVRNLQSEGESSFFRTIVVGTETSTSRLLLNDRGHSRIEFASTSSHERSKYRHINLSHIQEMLRSLDPVAASSIADMELTSERSRSWAPIFPDIYEDRVLTYDEVHRIALTTLGLHLIGAQCNAQLSWANVALAMGLLRASDITKTMNLEQFAQLQKLSMQNTLNTSATKAGANSSDEDPSQVTNLQRQRDLQRIAFTATKHEKRLMPGIADPDQIKTTFEQVHVPEDTIDSLRTITSLSLLRPEAFSYGILATEKISGALLYGPPGTGKTLLAKAVAKESGSTVLEVSGSQIMDKYVGEGEKNVSAIFSLARKLSPCIVFLDEADAVFASRDAMRERTSHRDILNQFLKEWDGLNDLSVFVMVATNRPFDLDDAVIRRLPRRLLVDLPTQVDRKEILKIHLKGEQLDQSVDLEDLAKRTPFYSGSDLKNIAVSAALACVKEENEQAATAAAKPTLQTDPSSSFELGNIALNPPTTTSTLSPAPKPPHLVRGQKYSFPETRILHARHFDKAIQEISASISEDMASLSAIKKFDEQYGDRKGNKRRKDFGFGMLAERNESAARVRI